MVAHTAVAHRAQCIAEVKSGMCQKKGKVVPSAEVSAVSCIASGALLASDADAAADVVGTEL